MRSSRSRMSVYPGMNSPQINSETSRKALRLWPGVIVVTLQWIFWVGVPIVFSDAGMYAFIGGFAGGLAVIVWWLFFSRAPWVERVGAILLMAGALYATSFVVHESIANGHLGMMLAVYGIPVLSLALVSWAAVTRRLSHNIRRASLVVASLLACGSFTLLRTGGIDGAGYSDLHWRWTETPEKRLLAQAGEEPVVAPPAQTASPSTNPSTAGTPEAGKQSPAEASAGAMASTALTAAPAKIRAEWPGFRGPARDGVASAARIETDWTKSPPVELWRRPVGPGWSSFAVQGDRFYTQEQRGEVEIVSAYNLKTGAPVWRHRDATRFWESNAGAGPRATPAHQRRTSLHTGRDRDSERARRA